MISTDRIFFIGDSAGYYNTTGQINVFLGAFSGYPSGVIINGNSTNNTFGRTLFVNGSSGGLYSWFNDSDRKLKHNIVTIPDALQKVLKIRGVNFLWDEPEEGMDG